MRSSLPFFLFPLAGILQTFSLAPYNFWILGPISVLLIVIAADALNTKKATISAKRSLLFGWLFGLGLFGSGASWVYVSIHVYGYASPFLATTLTLVFVAGLALFHSLQFYLYFRLRTASALFNTFLFTAIWIASDLFRSHFLTGFPWLFLGYSHVQGPLSGWVPVIGVYGITAVIVWSGCTLGLLPSMIGRKHFATGQILTLGSALGLWLIAIPLNTMHWTQASSEALKVSLMQLNIPQELKWQPAQRRKTLAMLETMSNEHWDSDILIWPETAIPMLYDQVLPYLDRMSALARAQDTAIISGIPYRHFDEEQNPVLHNSVVSFGLGEGINHKQRLVPFGEYVPLQEILRGLIAFFDLPMSDFRKGSPNQELLKARDFRVAPFICYEVVYPEFVRQRAVDSDLMLTISNDAWFGTSIGPLQHLQMAQMRAAENGRYMLRGTNNGVTAIIDQHGKIVAKTEQFIETVLEGEIRTVSGRTPYSYLGNIPIYLLILVSLILRFSMGSIKTRDPKASEPVAS